MAKILIIDDEEPIRKLLARILQKAGYETIQAANGREGVQLCALSQVDLVITDIVMPEGEGFETIMQLRRIHPDVKIFAMSGAAVGMNLDVLSIASSFGAIRTFEKPFQPELILNAVRDQLPALA
jgi:two-component system response regulator (stage 0 sporulation protein F)